MSQVGDLDLTLLLLMALAGFAAGWVDAVVGGGGLIQIIRPSVTPMATIKASHTTVTRMWGMPSRPSPVFFLGRPFRVGRWREGTVCSGAGALSMASNSPSSRYC